MSNRQLCFLDILIWPVFGCVIKRAHKVFAACSLVGCAQLIQLEHWFLIANRARVVLGLILACVWSLLWKALIVSKWKTLVLNKGSLYALLLCHRHVRGHTIDVAKCKISWRYFLPLYIFLTLDRVRVCSLYLLELSWFVMAIIQFKHADRILKFADDWSLYISSRVIPVIIKFRIAIYYWHFLSRRISERFVWYCSLEAIEGGFVLSIALESTHRSLSVRTFQFFTRSLHRCIGTMFLIFWY